eukprot:1681169-Prymnesium_polylepis.1
MPSTSNGCPMMSRPAENVSPPEHAVTTHHARSAGSQAAARMPSKSVALARPDTPWQINR